MSYLLIKEIFESLTPDSVSRLHEIYAPDARFKDPFNEVTGIEGIKCIFSHMFETLERPRFAVNETAQGPVHLYMHWTLHFVARREDRSIEGITRFASNDQGQIVEHIDYWDPVDQLYNKIPVFGSIAKNLTRRLAAPTRDFKNKRGS